MDHCDLEDLPPWIYFYKYCCISTYLNWDNVLWQNGSSLFSFFRVLFSNSLLKSFDPSKQKQLENDRNLPNLGPAKPSSSGRYATVKPTKPTSGNRIRSTSATSEDGAARYDQLVLQKTGIFDDYVSNGRQWVPLFKSCKHRKILGIVQRRLSK